MNRASPRSIRGLCVLAVALGAACAALGCGGDDKVEIRLFQAAPDQVEVGQPSTLVFVVEPADAALNLTGVGDLTGRTSTQVAPLATTTYQLTATRGHATATASVTVTVGASGKGPRLVLTLQGPVNAGYPVAISVAVTDRLDHPIPGYAGTVSFASTDSGTGAVTPPPIAFTGSEGGVAQTSATFVTVGPQTLSASDAASPQATGSAVAAVHGLVYTPPATGRVRLVANEVSTAQRIQLDLIASDHLELSNLFGGGPGPFAAGMNLPLDTTRVSAGSPLFATGAALPLGTGTQIARGTLGADHVLYTVIASKRVPRDVADLFFQSTDVAAGQVFYAVRLVLQPSATVGVVFDGADPSPLYRASVRDQYGDDVVSQGDIGVGRLEVR